MLRVFRHHLAGPSVLLWLTEWVLLFVLFRTGIWYAGLEEGIDWGPASFVNLIAAICALQAVLIKTALGLYNRDIICDARMMLLRLGLSYILNVAILTAIVLVVFPQIFSATLPPLFIVPLGMAGIFLLLICLRILVLNLTDRIHFQRRVLVIGAGDRAVRLIDRITDRKGHHFRIVGFVGIDGEAQQLPTQFTLSSHTNNLSGNSAQLWRNIEKINPDELVIAVDNRRILPIEPLLYCKFRGVEVTEFLTFVERELGRINIEDVTPSWLIFSDGFWIGLGARFWKRAFDITTSGIFLALFMPIIALAALVVRTQGDGPILFRQERIGQDGKPFTLVKFRTMKMAAKGDQPKWAAVNDNRITVAGKIMRSTRIDEIPQIFNVLKGDMSFVGPRPEQPFFVSMLERSIPYYAERHLVKPGITGWAQVNYPYGASIDDARQKLSFDLYYVKNTSLFLDFLILLQTVRVVIWPEGAR